jgi:16S rRNA U516 pseudouridylate synthase RsuA-like enzyme
MHVRLGNLPLGRWRNLTSSEVRALVRPKKTLSLRTRRPPSA